MLAALTIVFVIITRTTSQPYEKELSVKLTNHSYNDVQYEDGKHVGNNITEEDRGCACLKEKSVRKCCSPGEAYSLEESDCVPEPREFYLPVYEFTPDPVLVKGFNVTENFNFCYGKMTCSTDLNERRTQIMEPAKVRVNKDGNLYVDVPGSNVFIYGPDKYCIDTFVLKDEKPHYIALICYVQSEPEDNNYVLTSSCMLISCFFILLTVAVYGWLPELRNLHGCVLMVYLLSCFVGFLLLATMQILILKETITQDICDSLKYIVYFSVLSAFFWLNVMCYDIWWTFSGKPAHDYSGSPQKRFLYYAFYAFGVPTILTIVLAALEYSNLQNYHELLPNLYQQGCFLYGNSKLLYLYGPIVLLCVANMTFFGLTAFKIVKIKAETKMLHSKDSSTHNQQRQDTERFILYVKLFTVMGITWILEVIGYFYPTTDYFWRFAEAYNGLVGLIIFIIFVCKRNTWSMIKNRYKRVGQSLSRTQTTTSTSTSTTRLNSTYLGELRMNTIKK